MVKWSFEKLPSKTAKLLSKMQIAVKKSWSNCSSAIAGRKESKLLEIFGKIITNLFSERPIRCIALNLLTFFCSWGIQSKTEASCFLQNIAVRLYRSRMHFSVLVNFSNSLSIRNWLWFSLRHLSAQLLAFVLPNSWGNQGLPWADGTPPSRADRLRLGRG